jgi:mRNA interferase RelE/StbE
MPYRVELSRKAQKQLDRVPYRQAERIWNAILGLREEPAPAGAKRMAGAASNWRLRVGEYRVLYSIFRGDGLITIDSIKRRTTTTYKER